MPNPLKAVVAPPALRWSRWGICFVLAFATSLSGAEIPTPDQPAILRMLASKSKATCDAISTWRGEFAVEDTEFFFANRATDFLAAHAPDLAMPPRTFKKTVRGTINFVADFSRDRLLSSFVTEKPILIGTPDNERLGIELLPFEQTSIVTREAFLHFEPNIRYARSGGGGARIAFRDSLAEAAGQQWGTTVNPRVLFGYGGPTWENLEKLAKAAELSGGLKTGGMSLQIWRESSDSGDRYRILLPMKVGPERYLIEEMLFEERVDFNLVLLVIRSPQGGVHQQERWDYRNAGVLVLPTFVDYTLVDPPTQNLIFRRTLRVTQSQLNPALTDRCFGYTSLGLQEADVLEDRVTNTLSVVENGSLRRLEGGIDAYLGQPAPEPGAAP